MPTTTKKKPAICVYCKVCGKPFSVSDPKFAAMDPDLAKQNERYAQHGYRIEFVEDYNGEWCECATGKD